MKIVRIIGGLANQMFRYVFFCSLAEEHKNIKVDVSSFKNYFRPLELENVFRIVLPKANEKDLKGIPNFGSRNIFKRCLNKLFPAKDVYIERFQSYKSNIITEGKYKYYYGYWNSEKYGVWVTFGSIMNWITICDLGFGSGLKNKLSVAVSKNSVNDIKEYTSTAYFCILFIVLFLAALILAIIPFVNFQNLFNASFVREAELKYMFILYSMLFLLNFLLDLNSSVLCAIQKTFLIGVKQFLFKLFTIVLILLLFLSRQNNLLYVSLIFGCSAVASNIIISILIIFKRKEYIPRFSLVRKNKIFDILNLSISFFIIQIAVMVIFTTDNFIILQMLNPTDASKYNTVFQLYSILPIFFSILLIPLWPAFTTEYFKKRYDWIKKTIIKLELLLLLSAMTMTVLLPFAPWFIKLWTVGKIDISMALAAWMGIYTIMSIASNIYITFLSSISAMKIPLITSIVIVFLNIPLTILFIVKFNFGILGVAYANTFCLGFQAIISKIQTVMVLRKRYEQ